MKRDMNHDTRWLYARAGFLLLNIVLLTGAARVPAQAQSQDLPQYSSYPGTKSTPEQERIWKEYNRLVLEGERLRDAGKLDAAITLFKQAYEFNPAAASDICAVLGEAYYQKGQLREAEKAFQLAFAGRNAKPPTFYSTNPLAFARYALIEMHFQNWQEAFLAYSLGRPEVSEYKRENLPVFNTPVQDIMQKRELEAAVRMILLETIPITKRAERRAEVEKILVLSPKLALAHYELADKYLSMKYPNDREGYRKAAIPHLEVAIKYGNEDLQKRAQRKLTDLQKEEQNSLPSFVPIPQ